MNGSFSADPASAASLPVGIFRPDEWKVGAKRARSPVLQQQPEDADLVRPDAETTQKNVNAAYLQFGKPKDRRFAHKVHGAALAPAWEMVWTDEFSSTSDGKRNATLLSVHAQFAESVAANFKTSLDSLSKEGAHTFTKENVSKVRERINDIIEFDSPTARLSDLVLDMEHVAVTRMRNLAQTHLHRRSRDGYRLQVVVQHLDLARYANDIGHLCRSLRRDDQTYLAFGHLVGKLLCEAMYTKGVRAVNYMQLRLMRQEINRALQEAVASLCSLVRPVEVDKIGQPDSEVLYAYGADTLLFSQPHSGGSGNETGALSSVASVPIHLVSTRATTVSHVTAVEPEKEKTAFVASGIASAFTPLNRT